MKITLDLTSNLGFFYCFISYNPYQEYSIPKNVKAKLQQHKQIKNRSLPHSHPSELKFSDYLLIFSPINYYVKQFAISEIVAPV